MALYCTGVIPGLAIGRISPRSVSVGAGACDKCGAQGWMVEIRWQMGRRLSDSLAYHRGINAYSTGILLHMVCRTYNVHAMLRRNKKSKT